MGLFGLKYGFKRSAFWAQIMVSLSAVAQHNYRSGNKYSDLKLRMGPSESSCQSSRVPKNCGRASEVWSGARSTRLTLEIRAHRVAFGRSARSKKKVPSQNIQKVGAGWRQGSRRYERAGERPERTQAVGLKEWWACNWLSERVSLQPPADKRACPMSSIRNLSWPSQWRFQIPARIHLIEVLIDQLFGRR